jgi:hypothetical protein
VALEVSALRARGALVLVALAGVALAGGAARADASVDGTTGRDRVGYEWLRRCTEVFTAARDRVVAAIPQLAGVRVRPSYSLEPSFAVELALSLPRDPAYPWIDRRYLARVRYGNPLDPYANHAVPDAPWHDDTPARSDYLYRGKVYYRVFVSRAHRRRWNDAKLFADGTPRDDLVAFRRAFERAADACFDVGDRLGPPPPAHEITEISP